MAVGDPSDSTSTTARRDPSCIRLCVIVTVDITLQNLCRGRFEYFMERGYDVTVVCAPTPLAAEIEARGVRLHTAPLSRAVTPLRDLRALWNLYRFLKREQFDLIEVSTPKASLIGAVAARLAGAPLVVHLLRGLAYQHQKGLTYRLLRMSHRIACRFAHRVIAISQTNLEQACKDGVCSREKIVVLGQGSSNGVDLDRFSPVDDATAKGARRRLDIPDDAIVAGCVARMTRDKGMVELVDAFTALGETMPHLYLLLVGDYEQRDRPPPRIVEAIEQHPRILCVGWQEDTRSFFSVMDFFVLPTYREGLSTVLLEAAAMGLPLITTAASGWSEQVDDDATTLFVPTGDTTELKEAMGKLASSAELRAQLGKAGRSRVEQHYDNRKVWALQEQEFRRLLDR